MPRMPLPLVELLHRHAVREGDCLIYMASSGVERPRLPLAGTKPRVYEYVYRIAYSLAYGPIPPGYDVHHTCERPRCIEPEHLLAKTRAAHAAEHVREATTCKHGHPWTPENTYVRGYTAGGRPMRTCRRCRSLSQSARDRARRRAAR